jgi:hypothetical protein
MMHIILIVQVRKLRLREICSLPKVTEVIKSQMHKNVPDYKSLLSGLPHGVLLFSIESKRLKESIPHSIVNTRMHPDGSCGC